VTQLRETAVEINEKSNSHVTGKKGGRARRAVNGWPAMAHPVTTAPRSNASNESSTRGGDYADARCGERFRQGENFEGQECTAGIFVS
jgi:hypothetical protein